MARIIDFTRVAPVYGALRARARHDNVPTARFHRACQRALRALDAGSSPAVAVVEGYKALRPLHTVRAPGGAA